MKKEHPEYRALETIAALAFVSLVCALFFEVQALFYISLCLLAVGIFFKKVTAKIADVWLTAAHIIGAINTKILLAVIYFFVLVPIAYSYRLFHGDVMRIKQKNKAALTYWSERNHTYKAKDFENLW